MDKRARALLISLDQWLPPRIAWERAVNIAGPLLLLDGVDPEHIDPARLDPERAITDGLTDELAMNGLPASPERIADAIRAWRVAASCMSQTRLRGID